MWHKVKFFIHFYIGAITRYHVHSSFMYDFINHVLDVKKEYYAFDAIEQQRKKLLSADNVIEVEDFGAGSAALSGKWRKVSDIAKFSLSGSKKCRILFNLVHHYNCLNILELGASLGISTAYLAASNSNSKIVSLEGSQSIAAIAKDINKALDLRHVSIITGPFNETIHDALTKLDTVDLAYIDGHHASLPTLNYFESIIRKCHKGSIIVLDDIYWSEDMKSLWEAIKKRSDITLTVDLFEFGIVFLKPELSKQDIKYISFEYKPWQIGLFS